MQNATPTTILEQVGATLGILVTRDELIDVRTLDESDFGHGLTCDCCERDDFAGHAWQARMDQLRAAASSPLPPLAVAA
jgi:hypothetical protein